MLVRYMSILHPLRTVIPRNNAVYIITTIWLVAGLAAIPEPIFYMHGTYEDFQPGNHTHGINQTKIVYIFFIYRQAILLKCFNQSYITFFNSL